MSRSKLYENGPEIVENKIHSIPVAHIIPHEKPRKKMFDPSQVLYAASSDK
jgi:hypothetical protein